MDSLPHVFPSDNPVLRVFANLGALRQSVQPDRKPVDDTDKDKLPVLHLCRVWSDWSPESLTLIEPCHGSERTRFPDDPREAARPDRITRLCLLDIGVPESLIEQAIQLAARLDLSHSGQYPAMEVLFCEIVDEPVRVATEGATVLPVPALEEEIQSFAALVAGLAVVRKAVTR